MLDDIILRLKNRRANIMGHEYCQKTSVLLPLVHIDDQLHMLFEKRSLTLVRQPGEICFPGGKKDHSDKTPQQTAIRETCEELGLKQEDISVIAPMDVFVSGNLIVSPFLAYINDYQNIKPNPAEVDRLIFVPLEFLRNYTPQIEKIVHDPIFKDSFPFDLIPKGKDYPFRTSSYITYFYIYKDDVIWGLTARILSDFLEHIK